MDNYDDDDDDEDDKPSTHTADIIIYITIARVQYLTFTRINQTRFVSSLYV